MSELITKRLVLREFKTSDFDAVHEYASDPDVAKYMTWGPDTEADTKLFLNKTMKHRRQKPRREFVLAVCLNRGQEAGSRVQKKNTNLPFTVIGCVGLHVEKGKNMEAFISYCLNKKYWGCGYAFEAASSLINYGFNVLKIHRISAYCHPNNTQTHRVLEKLGMTYEGYLRDKLYFKGGWHDALVYSVIAD